MFKDMLNRKLATVELNKPSDEITFRFRDGHAAHLAGQRRRRNTRGLR